MASTTLRPVSTTTTAESRLVRTAAVCSLPSLISSRSMAFERATEARAESCLSASRSSRANDLPEVPKSQRMSPRVFDPETRGVSA